MKEKNPGFLLALPSMIVLFLFFIIPLFLVVLYSFQQPYSFDISTDLSLLNFKDFFWRRILFFAWMVSPVGFFDHRHPFSAMLPVCLWHGKSFSQSIHMDYPFYS